MARAKTGLDKQNSVLPIVIIGVTVAIVVGLIVGALWGLASSGNKPSNTPSTLPTTVTSASPTDSPTPTPTPTTASATPTPTTPSPTPTATPTSTTSPTPTSTASGGVPAYPAGGVAKTQSGNWYLNNYMLSTNSAGKFVVTARIVNTDRQPRVGYFTLYLYSTVTQAYLGTASATTYVPPETASPQGVAVTFASSTPYSSGATLVFVAY